MLLVSPPAQASGFVSLSRSSTGRLFEKHILSLGDLHYPSVKGGKVVIDEAFADTMIENFNNNVCDIVQVPKVDDQNKHSEDPDRNIGEVVQLTRRENKIFAVIDVRDETAADKLGKTLIGASAMLSLNYTDNRTGQKAGPTLLHVAVTNRPHIVELDDFAEIVAASAGDEEPVLLAANYVEEDPMDLETTLKTLKAEHNIDVEALQAKAELADVAVALSNAVKENLDSGGNIVALSSGENASSADDLINVIVEAGAQIISLSARVDAITAEQAQERAKSRVQEEVRKGRILPKDEDAQVELLLSNADLFERLLPETPIVRLSHEDGVDPIDPAPENNVNALVEKYSAQANN